MKLSKTNLLFFQRLITTFILLLFAVGCTSTANSQDLANTPLETKIYIPSQSDWVDHGTILEAGLEGEWDYYLWGGFAFSVLKKDGTFYLYYQGASDYRTEYDETVLWRSIGVATSKDGIHFTKYDGNPVLTWFPNRSGEEGSVSSGVTLGEDEEIMLFYGANTAKSATTVNADTRVASSTDGIDFTDLGVSLGHRNPFLWGFGDELFAVDAIYDQGKWIVYYIPNGSLKSGRLGVAIGNQYKNIKRSWAVKSGRKDLPVWGTASHVKLEKDIYALILNNVREKRTEVRLVSIQSPNIVSEPIATYQFDDMQQAVLLLDEEKGTWFLFYRTEDNRYGVKLAPANEKPIPTQKTDKN